MYEESISILMEERKEKAGKMRQRAMKLSVLLDWRLWKGQVTRCEEGG